VLALDNKLPAAAKFLKDPPESPHDVAAVVKVCEVPKAVVVAPVLTVQSAGKPEPMESKF
jgi:hypothetical protein